jgi:putative transposase
MTEALRWEGKVLGATVSHQAGWCWVSIQVLMPCAAPAHAGLPLGVDVGIKESAVDSDGQRHENQAPLRQHLRRIKRLQRTVSRRVPGSANRRKAVLQLAKAHYQVACQRSDSTHKLTTALARKGSLIGIESLNITGMLKNRHLSLSLSDAALSEIHRQLRYKTVGYGGAVVAIAPFFPSSQIHHGCGYRYRELTLAERVWVCPHCGAAVDRDLNAAKNIRDEALRLRAVSGVATSGREWPVDGTSDLPRKAMPDEAGMDECFRVLRK